jgi:lipooligosaccharide transport system permease protein
VWGEVLWAALLAAMYVVIVSAVLAIFHLLGVLTLDIARLPLALPIAFVAACAFAAFGLCFTALMPTIDHMNIPVFLIVIPVAFISGTYFPITQPILVALSTANPVYHLAQIYRGLLLGGPVAWHLGCLLVLVAIMLAVLVPLDLRLLRKRILGE